MKSNIRLHLVALCASLLALCSFTGCASTGPNSTLGPLVAEVAQARIAKEILDRNPSAAPKLQAVADSLGLLLEGGATDEISEAAIRGFVAGYADKWELTAPEQQLLVLGLLATRDRFLQATGAPLAKLDDPQVRIWITAVKRGIEAGIAAHKASR